MDREQARQYINSREPIFLNKAKRKGYVCPSCNNGTGSSGDGISRDPNTGHYKCFKCGLYEDVIGLIGIEYGISDPGEMFKKAYDIYGVSDDMEDTTVRKPINNNVTAGNAEQDHVSYYRECAAHMRECNYLKDRGISYELAARYMIGYDVKRQQVIIPNSKGSYNARNIREGKAPKYLKTGATHIFNENALKGQGSPVYVVEGEIDALSIIEAGGQAVGLCSATNYTKLLNYIREYRAAGGVWQQDIIISLDNDQAGEDNAAKLAQGLEELNVHYIKYNPCGNNHDSNEALVADREGFKKMVSDGIEKAKERKSNNMNTDITGAGNTAEAASVDPVSADMASQNVINSNVAAHMQEFIYSIRDRKSMRSIKTGFSGLDNTLGGGMYPGLYVVGAISSLGKTTFILQIADQIAAAGNDVLIFSLEMAKDELIAKSVSRVTYQQATDKRKAKTARGVLDGSLYPQYSSDERELIKASMQSYAEVARHVYIIEGQGETGIKEIKKSISDHIYITGNKPVVIIDYLQILAPYNERLSDKQNTDKAIVELKRISRDNSIPVIGISSFNRDNYNSQANMAAFKESGSIEYSSDVLIGLQLEGAGGSNFDEQAAKVSNPRKIEARILKQRNGASGNVIRYNYYPMFNYYEESSIEEKRPINRITGTM
jgi:replicative DNA helicase